MRLMVRGKNIELTQEIRDYAEAKLAHLTDQLADETAVDLELAEESGARHLAEASVHLKGQTLHASEEDKTHRGAIDRLCANLERQIVRYSEKRRLEPRRRTVHHD
jgi:putative sigma-54 modulation protein